MTFSAEELTAGRQNADIGTELLLENDAILIWHLRLPPGETIPAHRHDCPYFWTLVTEGQGVSQFDDGRVAPMVNKAGDTGNFPDLSPDFFCARPNQYGRH